MARAVDRVYRLLGLIYPWKDIGAARYAIEHGDARLRASALEYIDNLLNSAAAQALDAARGRRADRREGAAGQRRAQDRPRDAEETLLQLINDDDPIVAAAAIDLVEERKLWTLANDIEFVLAHRDAKDWYVFEAASWALAASRLPENRRRRLWIEPLPVVQLAARLRHMPVFASVSVAELFRIAASGRQTRYESGHILYQQGAVPEQLQFMLDGTVTAKAEGEDARNIVPPASLGFEQILEGSAMPETIRTAETTVCLAIDPRRASNADVHQHGLGRGPIPNARGRPAGVRPARDQEPHGGGSSEPAHAPAEANREDPGTREGASVR